MSKKDLEYIPTGSKVIDGVLNGGFPTKAISGVFSEYDVGKSYLAMQLASKLWEEEGLGTIYIDTEGHYVREDVRESFFSRFKDRFGHDENPDVNFLFPDDVYELGEIVGKEVNLVSESGARKIKVFLNDLETRFECKLARLMEDGNYGLVVVDSLTLPIKQEVPVPPRQNFPTRASAINALLGRISPIVKHYNSAGLVPLHETSDPAQGHYDTGDFVGGSGVGFHIKYMLQLKGKPGNKKRWVCPYRFPGKKSSNTKGESEELKLKENGFVP